MILSRKFVSDYVDIDVDIKTLADDMTSVGNEYDHCGRLLPVSNLVIGKVLECYDHPDSDHLHICKVDVGNDILQIVCGAPNVRVGLKVIVALDGASLPGGIIKKGNIRGQESNGMLCSIAELGLDHKFLKEEDTAGIAELGDDAIVGQDPIVYLQLDDEIIDFELTSNRGDLLSVLGMAHEISALYGKKVKDMDVSFHEEETSLLNDFSVDIQTENCSLFLIKKVENVKIGKSPLFIKNRLIASGIRPINNVVDISNYVMLETGQPLHFYDADLLGNCMSVRMAREGETLTTLDNQERILSSSDIVITDNEKAVGLAGVMGGLTTEINANTKNIVIESAIFDPTLIRKTSKKVLRSEASNRFEKGIDPKRSYLAMMRSCHLLEKYADAKVISGMIEYNQVDMEDKVISISANKINRILGIEIPLEEIATIFRRLGFSCQESNGVFEVVVPTRRRDITIEEDLIEEVGRIYGIDNIIGKKMVLPVKPGRVNKDVRIIRNKLAELGLNETLSYALTKEMDVHKFSSLDFDAVKVLDPMSEDRNTLRYSLIPSLLTIYDYNKARGNQDICLYEVGKGFSKQNEKYQEDQKLAILMSGFYDTSLQPEKVDFYVLKGVIEELLDYLGYANRYSFVANCTIKELHPGQCAMINLSGVDIGIIGKVHPKITKDDIFVAEINLDQMLSFRTKKMQYKELSKYPSIVKDVAFVVDENVTNEMLGKTIKKACGRLLVSMRLFDVYTGENIEENKKSLAYTLTFQDASKTLSEEEVMTIFNKMIEVVSTTHQARLRDK